MIDITLAVEELQRRYEGVAEVSAVEVKKSHGVRKGIVIKEFGKLVTPNIYVEGKPFDDIDDLGKLCDKVQEAYENYKTPDFDIEMLNDFEACKGRIIPRLINEAYCAEGYLDDKPCRPWADLYITYVVKITTKALGQGSALINNQMLETWDVTEADLFEIAGQNIRPALTDMVDVMAKMYAERGMGDMFDIIADQMPRGEMFVLCSENVEPQGAAVLPYYVEELKDRFGKFVALPSSVHEWLIVPVGNKECFSPDTDMLTGMVQEVNATAVDLEDRLADHSYYFNGEEFVL